MGGEGKIPRTGNLYLETGPHQRSMPARAFLVLSGQHEP